MVFIRQDQIGIVPPQAAEFQNKKAFCPISTIVQQHRAKTAEIIARSLDKTPATTLCVKIGKISLFFRLKPYPKERYNSAADIAHFAANKQHGQKTAHHAV